jgi:hypothetical protein
MPPEVERALIEIMRWRSRLAPIDFYMVIRDHLEGLANTLRHK